MIPITPAPTVHVPTYFGLPISPALNLIFMILLVIVSIGALMYFGWEFARKWRQYRQINKYVENEEEE